MAALPSPARSLRRSGDDEELVERIRRGDELAFAAVHARYRSMLERYAARMLGSQQAAEDAVQDVFIRAHQALLRDDRHIDLKPWLYALTRNRALDELRKPKADHVALHDAGEQPQTNGFTDPEQAVERRQELRQVVHDLLELPDRQREVLLRREVDGRTHEQVATEFGITVAASKKLVNRARENLVKTAEARNEGCAVVRRELLKAHDQHRRSSAHVYRHLTGCRDCREFRSALGTTRTKLAALGLPLPGLGVVAAAVKGAVALLPGVGGGSTVAGKVATTAAITAAVAGGAFGVAQVTGPGDPSPMTVRSAVFFGGVLYSGDKMPSGTAMVRKTVKLHAGAAAHPSVTLQCPPDMRVAGLAPHRGADVGHGYAPQTVVGSSSVARVMFEPGRLPTASTITVGTVCKRPNAVGSVLAAPVFFAATTRMNRICARRSYLFETPGGLVVGTVFRGQPVTRLKRTANRRWWRIRTDAGVRGWVRSTAICTGGTSRS
jgi:RNA polymerase sigma factor (sigma-70 family)